MDMAEYEVPLLSDSGHDAIGTSYSRSDISELVEGRFTHPPNTSGVHQLECQWTALDCLQNVRETLTAMVLKL